MPHFGFARDAPALTRTVLAFPQRHIRSAPGAVGTLVRATLHRCDAHPSCSTSAAISDTKAVRRFFAVSGKYAIACCQRSKAIARSAPRSFDTAMIPARSSRFAVAFRNSIFSRPVSVGALADLKNERPFEERTTERLYSVYSSLKQPFALLLSCSRR